ncbi:hypothetical protein [Fulvivirga ligni]|uniref:hypothetical protein n=1 Tax=Fulvivirga ligni TaxID=2904246 RepID=UPI001F2E2904|nr:hypothetical protein [Fulvivirga ligni]UII23621.1 hypothetical protein LVD16_10315 [Fulvivirga ligni]
MMKKTIIVLSILGLMACEGNSNKEKDQVITAKKQETEVDTIDNSHLIIPGKSLAHYQLNGSIEQIQNKLGQPDDSNAGMGKSVRTWNIDSTDILSAYTTRQMGVEDIDRIKIMRTTSPKYLTQKHLGTGSTKQEIETEFKLKPIGTFQEKSADYNLYGASSGIAFEFDQEENCAGVCIYYDDVNIPAGLVPIYESLKAE